MRAAHTFPATDFRSVRILLEDALESNCRHLFALWDELRGDRIAPAWKEIDLMRLPPRVIAFIRVVDVRHDPFDLVYRFWGTGLVAALGSERTGKSVFGPWPGRAPHTRSEYEKVIEEKTPYAIVYNARSVVPDTPIYAPAIRLPLSDDGERVTNVIACTDFGADQETWRRLYEEKLAEGA